MPDRNETLKQEAAGGMLGVLGGMGPAATELFFRWLIGRTDAVCDQEHVPALILNDSGMPDRTAAILSGGEEADSVYRRLLSDARLLENAGCSTFVIPCNTSHFFADRLETEVGMKLLHMPRLAAREAGRRHSSKVAVLATDGTLETGVYHTQLEALGIEPWQPGPDIRQQVMHLIYDVVKAGLPGRPEDFAPIDEAVRAAACDAAILACTELSVFRHTHGLPDSFYLDAMELTVEEAVRLFCPGRLKPRNSVG